MGNNERNPGETEGELEGVVEASNPEKIIGTPAGKKFWITGGAIVGVVASAVVGTFLYLNNLTLENEEGVAPLMTKQELEVKSQERFRRRYEEWQRVLAPKFISFVNTDAMIEEEYFDRLKKLRQEHPYKLAFDPNMSEDKLPAWREQVKSKLVELITDGQSFPEKTDLDIRAEKMDSNLAYLLDDPSRKYTLEQISYSTGNGRRLRALLAKPRDIRSGQKLPAILALPGHHGTPESIFMVDSASMSSAIEDIETYAFGYGHLLANQGYIVLAPDTGGCKYITPHKNNYITPPEGWLDDGIRAWSNIRSLDVLCSFLEVDVDRLGTYGFSLGGAESLYLAVLDKRIKAAVVAGFLGGYDPNTHCRCNQIPDFREWFRKADLAISLAPDRLLIGEDGKNDQDLGGWEEGKDIRFGFDALGANNRYSQIMTTGGHCFYGGEQTTGMLDSVLRSDVRN